MKLTFRQSFRFHPFPDTPVIVKGACSLFYENQTAYRPVYRLSSHDLFLPTEQKWPVGAQVRISLRILEEIQTYEGLGEIVEYCECPQGLLGAGLFVRILELKRVQLGLKEKYLQWRHGRDIAVDVSYGAAKYILGEIQGNRVEKDFGEPHAGFRRPVLLIQGLFGTRGVFSILENKLKRDGFPVFSFSLGRFNVDDITKSARLTANKLLKLAEEHSFEKVDIVGHSMGGLIGLYAIKKFGISHLVNRFVAVGTPFYGTPMSYLGVLTVGPLVKSVRQMTPISSFIQELHADPLPPGIDYVSILSRHDLLVPNRSCVLKGAVNLLICTGHAALVVNENTYEVLRTILLEKSILESWSS